MTNQNYSDPTTMQDTAKTVSADPVPIFENAVHIGGSTAGSTDKAKMGGDDNNVTQVNETWREWPPIVSLEKLAEIIQLSQRRTLALLSDIERISSLTATMPLPIRTVWSEPISMLQNEVQQEREAMKSLVNRVLREVDEIRCEVENWPDDTTSLTTCQQPE
ncbi:hypothetical protein BELL_0954g00020 [Botrytis elliptica]|uniref:Uncharacterized protein n=1 Tax=Botrytis elliptica TaxID=278938 RepID=A0A4Z1JBZ8_9HELO|nr:hypothetical protein EAE99_005387 [Botrytis elliptica]TGO66457.1 hypothetical protein BELL_0954g00020 [Botrytis elliptica]